MFINKISASKSDVIDQCLLKYSYKYNDKIPGFGSSNEEALNFGSFIHKVFEIGYKHNDHKTLMKLAESERKTFKIPFQMDDRIKICVENFVRWNAGLGETVSTEIAFEVDLDKEAEISLNGVIDRVVKGTQGGYLVIDYKTSKREKTKAELLTDKQLMGYAYAVSILHNVKLSEIHCAHYYPVTGHFISVRFSAFQIARWKSNEIAKVWRIRKKKKDEFYPMENIFCGNCEMKPACPKFNSPEEVCSRLEEQFVLRDKLRALREEEKAKVAADKIGNDDKENVRLR